MSTEENEDEKKRTASEDQCSSPPPLDGGWGWMVVLAAAVCFALLAGFQKSFSLIYEELLVRFQENAFTTATVSAIFQGLTFFSGPLVGSLSISFGHRNVALVGGFFISLGVIISAYVPSVTVMYFTYGVLSGLGTGMLMTVSLTMVTIYFEKKRGIAVALATATAGLGGAIYGPMLMGLLNHYGYSGTMLICGGIFLNTCAAAALYRPLKDNYSRCNPNPTIKRDKTQTPLHLSDKNLESLCDGLEGDVNDFKRSMLHGKIKSQSRLGSLVNVQIDPMGSCADIHHESVKEKQEIKASDTSEVKYKCARENKCISGVCKFIDGLDIGLFKNPTFSFFCLQICAMNSAFYMQILFLSGFTTERGFTQEHIAILIVLLNVIDGVLRIMGGFVFDLGFVKDHLVVIHSLVNVIGYIILLAMGFMTNMYSIYILWSCTQACLAVFHSQHTNALAYIVQPTRMTSAYGLVRFVSGIGVVVAPLLGGYIKDVTHTYWLCYVVAGAFGLIANSLFLLHLQVKRCIRTGASDIKTEICNTQI